MKLHSSLLAGLVLLAAFALGQLEEADLTQPAGEALDQVGCVDGDANYTPIEAKKPGDCSFKSDCKGAKCCKSRCAWASGSCCSFDSDCGFKGAKCRSGKCSNAPDGKCSFSSECPSGKCSSGKCK